MNRGELGADRVVIDNAKAEHLQWSLKIDELASADSNIRSCTFTPWFDNNRAAQFGQPELFGELIKAHEAFHDILEHVITDTRQPMSKEDAAAHEHRIEQL